MENNIGSASLYNKEQLNNSSSVSGNHVKENLKEFKHCVLLHEKGLAMQDSSNNASDYINLKVKHKSNSHSNKVQSTDHFSENLEEVNELRRLFNERHQ